MTTTEQKGLALSVCEFFSATLNKEHRTALGLPLQPGKISPLGVGDFLRWSKINGTDYYAMHAHVRRLIARLESAGVLVRAGTTQGSPGFNECYHCFHELTARARLGDLWLGVALGAGYVAAEAEKAVVRIVGITPKGDPSVGTGTLVAPGVVLTCAHVVDDMKVETVELGARTLTVKRLASHPRVDIGIIHVAEEDWPLPDLTFRPAMALEEVVAVGFPQVPRSTVAGFVAQRGEVNGEVTHTLDGQSLLLFSAIARPGSSGSPVLAMDGRVVGVVTRSLERPREEADAMPQLPFFAAVPFAEVVRAAAEIDSSVVLPIESWQ